MAHKNKLLPLDFLKFAMENKGVISFDCETTGKNGFTCRPILYTLSAGHGAGMHTISLLPSDMVHDYLNTLFTDPNLKIVMHNSSFDCKVVHRFICPFRKIRAKIIDTIVLAWLYDNRGAAQFGKRFSLKSLSQKYLGYKMNTLTELFKTGDLAVKRKALEKAAAKLKKSWRTIAKRHEARIKRAMRQQHSFVRQRIDQTTEMTRAEKSEAKKALTEKYKTFAYNYDRAKAATKRLLEIYKKKHEKINAILWAKFIDYALDDASVTLRLFWLFRKKLTKMRLDKWAIVELDNRMLATDMEINGVEIDYGYLTVLDKSFEPDINEAAEACYALAGKAANQARLVFNIDSPREVSVILHSLCGAFPDQRYADIEETSDSKKAREKDPTVTPWFRTSKRVLTYTDHPLARKVLEYRQLVKLRGTYTRKLSKVRGRLHAYFRSSGTDTGRYSSSGPNLQNIPSRSAVGKRIRKAFKAKKDHKLIVADLSQIELRVGGTICREPSLLDPYNQFAVREDGTRDYSIVSIHKQFHKQLQEISPIPIGYEAAKTANFALLYGQHWKSFAILYQLDFETAEATHRGYFEIRQNVAAMLDQLGEMWRRYKIRSWRIPFSGRMRHWDRYDYIVDPDTGEEERVDTYVSKGNVLNTLVQGSAADVFKMALRAFWRYVVLNPKYVDKVFPIMQVHDEVSVEVHESVAVEVAQLLKYCMEYPWFEMPCPILADVHIVDNWGEGKDGKREVIGPDGQLVLDEDGKPKKEVVNPEMNAQIDYLRPAVMEWCKTVIPEVPPIEIHSSFTVSKEELAAMA